MPARPPPLVKRRSEFDLKALAREQAKRQLHW